MRKTGLCVVLSALIAVAAPSSNVQAATWTGWAAFECNIRSNIARSGLFIKDRKAAYEAQMDYCLNQIYPM